MGADDPTRRRRRGPDRWLLLAAALTLGLGLVGAMEVTLIPRALDDNLRGVADSTDGPDYITFFTDEHDAMPAYAVYEDRFGGRQWLYGQQPVRKDAWSRTLVVGDRSIDLLPPRVFYEYLAVLALLVAAAMVRWHRRPPELTGAVPDGTSLDASDRDR